MHELFDNIVLMDKRILLDNLFTLIRIFKIENNFLPLVLGVYARINKDNNRNEIAVHYL